MTHYKKILSVGLASSMVASVLMMNAGALDYTESNNYRGAEAPKEYVSEELARLDTKSLTENQYNEVVEASRYAYLDLSKARSTEMQEKILSARSTIIFSQSWDEDGGGAYVVDVTGEIIEIPEFHELFPSSWELPKVNEGSVNMDNETRSADEILNNITQLDNARANNNYIDFNSHYVTLKKASDSANAPDYTTEVGLGISSYLYASKLPGTTWNGGFSRNGVSVGYKNGLKVDQKYVKPLIKDQLYGLRASTHDKEGSAKIVFGYVK